MSEAICAKCNEVISQRIVTALDKSWHPEHFACRECHTPITESTFNQKDGEPVCTQCYALKYLDVCFSCKEPIKGKTIKALGRSWHEEHFVCGGACQKPLSGASFYEKDGSAYCKEDYDFLFAAKCIHCFKPITDKAIIALNGKWHKDCFRCKMCDKPITSSTFAVEDNKPVCTECVA